VAQETRTARDRLDRIFSIIKRATRFWAAGLAVLVAGGAISVAVAVLKPRVYKSETLMLFREGIRSSDLGGPDSGGDPARKLGLKLKEMVFSRTSLAKIIDEFKLYPKIMDDRGYVDAVDEMRTHIAFRVKDGDTFGLSFEGEDPRRVQAVTARLAEMLMGENTKTRSEQAEVTKEFLDAEKTRAEGELKEKETNLAKFLSKHPEFAKETVAPGAGGAGTAFRATASKAAAAGTTRDPTLLALEREASRIQERLGVPMKKKTVGESQADPRLVAERQAAESEVQQAQRDVADKLAQFTEQHPDVRAAKSRLKGAEGRLRKAQEAITADLAGAAAKKVQSDDDEGIIDRGTLEAQLRKVQDEISQHKAKQKAKEGPTEVSSGAQWIVALETEWTRLNREVSEARERNQQLQDKQFKASMAESAAASGRNAQMVVIDPAYKPTHPAKLGRTVIVGVGVGASFAIMLFLLIGLALLDDRLYDRVDIERLELLPLIGVVPRGDGKKRKRG
jgi:uncharacterized protein involved in exopolysaccharide biosynthesis